MMKRDRELSLQHLQKAETLGFSDREWIKNESALVFIQQYGYNSNGFLLFLRIMRIFILTIQ